MKNIALLGSTGSIGEHTLKVVRHLPKEFCVKALAAKSNIDQLERQAKEFLPELIAVYDPDKALELQKRLPSFRVVSGLAGLEEAASLASVDTVVNALTSSMGILPTVAAIKNKKHVALANKETLVSAGKYITDLVEEYQTTLIPIDSEHTALFQCIQGNRKEDIRRLILTASGGPFLNVENLENTTIEDALKHPNWKMGPKVTIDSSTLMNKGLELIEAFWLFKIPLEKIEVVIHPQSIIHSMIEYKDASIMAQLSNNDMALPVQYALTYPKREACLIEPFDFTKYHRLEFLPPNKTKFICLELAYESLRLGGSAPCFLNAANEVLVERYLNKQISWLDIGKKLSHLIEKHTPEKTLNLDTILEVDREARVEASFI